MSHPPKKLKGQDWEQFVLDYGFRAHAHYLGAVVGKTQEEVEHVRRTAACTPTKTPKKFQELFSLWHGRAPEDSEWPAPRKIGARSSYDWQLPEIVLLASLVGTTGINEISTLLTARLRKVTGDQKASRNKCACQGRINHIGLQVRDVIGGISTAEAGREIGSLAIINQLIHKRQIPAVRRGNLWVIPYDAWEEWKSKRVFPPKGYVLLTSIKDAMSIRSDKLSEFARMGHIPTAIRCNPYGTKGPSTQYGTWYIDKQVGKQLVADRRAGKPMPWHGKPLMDNLKATFKVWQKRKHPKSCTTCAEIWGKKGAPETFEDYVERYAPLAHGAKRHLTRPWSPGMTMAEVAQFANRSIGQVTSAINNGMLDYSVEGKRKYVTRTEATRWKSRKCPTGRSEKSWISIEDVCAQYFFTPRELRGYIASGELLSKSGEGTMKGKQYVLKHQCRVLREKIGFTEDEAARRIGITVERFRRLLEGVDWRGAKGIPLATVQAVIKRLNSRAGYSVEEAAEKAEESVQWVMERVHDGTIKLTKAKWDLRRLYITEPMFQRLLAAKNAPAKKERFNEDWLRLSDAAFEAGVTSTTLIKWSTNNELPRKQSKIGWRYHREAVRARARAYWSEPHSGKGRTPQPKWLKAEASAL